MSNKSILYPALWLFLASCQDKPTDQTPTDNWTIIGHGCSNRAAGIDVGKEQDSVKTLYNQGKLRERELAYIGQGVYGQGVYYAEMVDGIKTLVTPSAPYACFSIRPDDTLTSSVNLNCYQFLIALAKRHSIMPDSLVDEVFVRINRMETERTR